VPLQQCRDDLFGLGGRAAALEAEPHQVHAEQSPSARGPRACAAPRFRSRPAARSPRARSPRATTVGCRGPRGSRPPGECRGTGSAGGSSPGAPARDAEERLALVGRPVAIFANSVWPSRVCGRERRGCRSSCRA
jgi:hypothetical protein